MSGRTFEKPKILLQMTVRHFSSGVEGIYHSLKMSGNVDDALSSMAFSSWIAGIARLRLGGLVAMRTGNLSDLNLVH
jgi:hypothetical protein